MEVPEFRLRFGIRDHDDQSVCLMTRRLTTLGWGSWRNTRATRVIGSLCRVAGKDIDLVRRARRHPARLAQLGSRAVNGT